MCLYAVNALYENNANKTKGRLCSEKLLKFGVTELVIDIIGGLASGP